MSTQLLERPTEAPATGGGRSSHIIRPDDKREAAAIVTEARVLGLEVEALCGHRWVPQHDPKQYPVCQKCLEILKQEVGQDHGWTEA